MIELSTYNTLVSQNLTGSYSTEALQKKIAGADADTASDEELMEACKSFESYFVEQVIKEMKKTVKSEEEEGDYMQYFGDTLYQEYAKAVTESGQLGIAQMMYDSMHVETVDPASVTGKGDA